MKSWQDCTIPVKHDRSRFLYILEVSEEVFGDFQRLIIQGGKKERINVFFKLDDKIPHPGES